MWPIVALVGIGLAAMVAVGFLPADNPTAGRVSIIVSGLMTALVTILYTRYSVEKKVDEVKAEVDKVASKQEVDSPTAEETEEEDAY